MCTSLSSSPRIQNASLDNKTEITKNSFRPRTKTRPKIDSDILFEQYYNKIKSLEISENTIEYSNMVPSYQSQKEETDPKKIMTEIKMDLIQANPHKLHDVNCYGQNALHIAIEENNTNLVRSLLICGSSPNTPNEITDQSPLQLAENMKNNDIKELLIKHGARPTLRKFI